MKQPAQPLIVGAVPVGKAAAQLLQLGQVRTMLLSWIIKILLVSDRFC